MNMFTKTVGLLSILVIMFTSCTLSQRKYSVEMSFGNRVLKYDNLTREQYNSFLLYEPNPNSKLHVGTVEFTDDFVNGDSKDYVFSRSINGETK